MLFNYACLRLINFQIIQTSQCINASNLKISQKITDDATIEKEEIINTFDGKKVLVVDDNKLNIKVASKILKEFI